MTMPTPTLSVASMSKDGKAVLVWAAVDLLLEPP